MTEAWVDSPHHQEDLHAWQILRPLLGAGGYLPWSTGAMRPAGLVRVCNDVVFGDRRSIVECGSGVSTVVLARLLRERGVGRVVSLEHDATWAARVRELLDRDGVADLAEVVEAPLEGDPPWYAHRALAALPETIDLLIVDGPPAYRAGEGLRRAPALDALGPRLATGASIVLDDIDRVGEREVLAGWERDSDWEFESDEVAGVAVGARR